MVQAVAVGYVARLMGRQKLRQVIQTNVLDKIEIHMYIPTTSSGILVLTIRVMMDYLKTQWSARVSYTRFQVLKLVG